MTTGATADNRPNLETMSERSYEPARFQALSSRLLLICSV
jgi:hypothetical protein